MKKIFKLKLVLMMFGLFTPSVHANEVCNSIEDCRELKANVEGRLEELLKDDLPDLTDILAEGIPQYEAKKICSHKNMRLPTARELALVSQSLGAEGISETKKDGYYLVIGSDSAGNSDPFYFSHKGYKRPVGDLGSNEFWSSSAVSTLINDTRYVYTLNGYNGSIGYYYRPYHGFPYRFESVRCVRSR